MANKLRSARESASRKPGNCVLTPEPKSKRRTQVVVYSGIHEYSTKDLHDAVGTTFGKVTIYGASRPAGTVRRKNVIAGQDALERAKGALQRSGVNVVVRNGIPLYHVDPNDPSRIIRTLNGKTSSGTFVGGKFKPLHA